MVDEWFHLSKLESGRIDLSFANVSLNELVQQCVGMMQPQANRARIIIRSALTSGLPRVKADERALRQIMVNLLSNAIKFTGPGGQIIVSTVFSDAREAILRVRDTGAGMREKQIAAALEPFADIDAWAKSGACETEFGLPLDQSARRGQSRAVSDQKRAGGRNSGRDRVPGQSYGRRLKAQRRIGPCVCRDCR